MYSLTQDVVKGVNIVTALQNYPNMPSSSDIFNELDYLVECIQDTERFYGVPFKKPASDKDVDRKHRDQFDVVSDIKGHFEEFYFGSKQELIFGYRPRAYYRLVVEPLLDSMNHLSHDEVLDYAGNVVEQIKEHIMICEHQNRLDAAAAYKLYRQVTTERQQEKKIKEAVAGVMKLRKKTLALQAQMKQSQSK